MGHSALNVCPSLAPRPQKTNVTVDWNRWVDSDEEDGDFDTSGMAGMDPSSSLG